MVIAEATAAKRAPGRDRPTDRRRRKIYLSRHQQWQPRSLDSSSLSMLYTYKLPLSCFLMRPQKMNLISQQSARDRTTWMLKYRCILLAMLNTFAYVRFRVRVDMYGKIISFAVQTPSRLFSSLASLTPPGRPVWPSACSRASSPLARFPATAIMAS